MANDAFKRHKRFHLLEKDNSLFKRSKCVKVTRYVEQTLGKKSTLFWHAPCVKMYTQGGARGGCPPFAAGFEGAQLLALIVLLVWLLRGRRMYQFVSLGGN